MARPSLSKVAGGRALGQGEIESAISYALARPLRTAGVFAQRSAQRFMSTASGLQILEALSYTVFAGAHSCICSASETLRARFDLQLGLSMSSALKNAVKRKTHKERSQP